MLSLTMLTDHPLVPHFDAEIRTYSEGFLVEKMDGAACLPLLVSIGRHVDRVWTVDAADCMGQAMKVMDPLFLKERNLPDVTVPPGMLIIFRLKSDDAEAAAAPQGDADPFAHQNPLERTLPLVGSEHRQAGAGAGAKHIAVFVRTGSRSATAVSSATSHWRVAMRMHDVQEHKGGADVAIPAGVLRAYLSLLDYRSEGVPSTIAATDTTATSSGGDADSKATALVAATYKAMVATAVSFAQCPGLQIPGAGFYAMRCVHSVSDALRLSRFKVLEAAGEEVSSYNATSRCLPAVDLVVLVGHAGTGLPVVAAHLASQLGGGDAVRAVKVAEIDFAKLYLSLPQQDCNASSDDVSRYVDGCLASAATSSASAPSNKHNEVLLVSVIQSASQHMAMADLLSMLAAKVGSDACAVVSLLSSSALKFGAADAPDSQRCATFVFFSSCTTVYQLLISSFP
jgi:hypothetical protein